MMALSRLPHPDLSPNAEPPLHAAGRSRGDGAARPIITMDARRDQVGPVGPPNEVDLSVVAPAHNEEDNVGPLIDEVAAVLGGRPDLRFEMVVVDDGSTDRTFERLQESAARYPWLRVIRMLHTPPGRGLGQSAAFRAGFAATRGRLIAVMDADRQNDPADLPEMLRLLALQQADMVQGDRSRNRRDRFGRRIASWVGRTFRRMLLGDTIRDTGCSLRVMKREVALSIPLEFRGLHRFIPVTARHLGYKVIEVPVSHRPRIAGEAKYGLFDRAIPGLIDCLGVRWMRNRRRPTQAVEMDLRSGRPMEASCVWPPSEHAGRVAEQTREGPAEPPSSDRSAMNPHLADPEGAAAASVAGG